LKAIGREQDLPAADLWTAIRLPALRRSALAPGRSAVREEREPDIVRILAYQYVKPRRHVDKSVWGQAPL